jgi:multiple sugar transport system ATP-binding protein
MRMIAGLEDPSSGEIHIGGRVVNDLEPKDRDIAMVFQSYGLYPNLTVYENVRFPLKVRRVDKATHDARVRRACDMVELGPLLHRHPRELSGGQRQRVAIARALVTKPVIVLADEPTANLDSQTGDDILNLMRKINKDLKTTFIFSTHDAKIVELADHIIRLKDGLITENYRATSKASPRSGA